jgi:hypothetical protein
MPTAIGDVVPALVAVFDAALAAEPTIVYAGPQPTSENAEEYVTVGWDPEGGEGVTSDQEPSDMGNRWIDESGDVIGSVTCWSGDTDDEAVPTLLARCDDLLDLLDAALAADPTLGGVLVGGADDGSYARVLGRAGMTPTTDQNGTAVRITFTTHYSTLLT